MYLQLRHGFLASSRLNRYGALLNETKDFSCVSRYLFGKTCG
jgi:hypothetical protein